ncbi:hypothetical protein CRP01_34425 [Flavilitoribacter nigricans DSM 23189 = NBRC 102662]|uniref:Galactose oxidase n=1 Tax=Flavilitoribacter nigricans (strain ATCC 23147 / DSM 23189 / NBRC 102662 / NCIMB 1420 / SS-2) TaxID=1122177 RepID=A0A2D0N0F9_FLAN2|nr:hypothetical protein CRP01_34425 [Flavilitoribacter nigricans DSM 23189 = NBRC 102662]
MVNCFLINRVALIWILGQLLFSCEQEFAELDFVNAELLAIEKTGINAARFQIGITGIDGVLAPENLPTEFGLVWSTDNLEPTLADNKETINMPLANGVDYSVDLTDLLITASYYCRAFVKVGSREVYSETRTLSFGEDFQIKLLPDRVAITNDQAEVSAVLIINREDTLEDHGFVFCPSETFPGLTDPDKVKSKGQTDRDGEFSATLDSLDFNTDYHLWAYAVLNGEVIISEPIIFSTIGGWRKFAIIDNQEFKDPVGESFGAEAIILMGCGLTACSFVEAADFKTIWTFNPGTDQGATILPSSVPMMAPLARVGSVSFKLNGKFYFGLGQIEDQMQADFWSYDPGNGMWMREQPFPGILRKDAFGVSLDGKGYIGTGCRDLTRECIDGWLDDVWSYDPIAGAWDSIGVLPLYANNQSINRGRTNAVAFVVNDRLFAGFGYTGLDLNDLWEFDPNQENWARRGSFDVQDSGQGIVTVPIGSSVFLGLSEDLSSDAWYELSIPATANDSFGFEQRQSLPNDPVFPTAADFVFEINGRVYMVGTNNAYNSTDIWEYVPAAQ